MSIAEKLTAIAENVHKVYEAGKAAGGGTADGSGDMLYYAVSLDDAFSGVVFSENYQAEIKLQKSPQLFQTFQDARNVKTVVLICDEVTDNIYYRHTFRNCKELETVDLTRFDRRLKPDPGYLFNASNLKSIFGALDCTGCTDLTLAFITYSLVDVEFVPNTISCNIRFPSANLSAASIDSIIEGLADLTGGEAKTLTLNGVGASLTDEQKAAISAKNWTLVY